MASIKRDNFDKLKKLVPEIIDGKSDYIKMTAGEGFMPLSIQHLYDNRYSMAHNYVQNGDLMADPDMEIVIDRAAKTVSARTFQQDNIGFYQSADEGNNAQVIYPRMERELNAFLKDWLSNIEAQEYQKQRMDIGRDGESVQLHFDADGNIADIVGSSELAEQYRKDADYVLNKVEEHTEEGYSFIDGRRNSGPKEKEADSIKGRLQAGRDAAAEHNPPEQSPKAGRDTEPER